MTNAAQESMGNAPYDITIDGVAYKIDPMRKGKIWSAIKRLKSRWMQDYLDSTRMVPLPDAVRGSAIATISCKTPEFLDVLNDLEATSFFVSLQITADGKPMTVDHIMNVMPNDTYRQLTAILLNAGTEADSDAGPLGDSTSTTATDP